MFLVVLPPTYIFQHFHFSVKFRIAHRHKRAISALLLQMWMNTDWSDNFLLNTPISYSSYQHLNENVDRAWFGTSLPVHSCDKRQLPLSPDQKSKKKAWDGQIISPSITFLTIVNFWIKSIHLNCGHCLPGHNTRRGRHYPPFAMIFVLLSFYCFHFSCPLHCVSNHFKFLIIMFRHTSPQPIDAIYGCWSPQAPSKQVSCQV